MTYVQEYKKLQDFLDANKERILKDYYPFFHFLENLKKINKGEIDVYGAFNVVGHDSKEIMCIWTQGTLYLYGENWDEEMIKILLERINPQRFKRFQFIGQNGLVKELFRKANIDFDWKRDRIVYSCTSIKKYEGVKDGVVENASFEYFDQLAESSILYYKEEFEGKGIKSVGRQHNLDSLG